MPRKRSEPKATPKTASFRLRAQRLKQEEEEGPPPKKGKAAEKLPDDSGSDSVCQTTPAPKDTNTHPQKGGESELDGREQGKAAAVVGEQKPFAVSGGGAEIRKQLRDKYSLSRS